MIIKKIMYIIIVMHHVILILLKGINSIYIFKNDIISKKTILFI